MILQFPWKFSPRDYQRELLHALLIDKYKHLFYIVHRRGGKDKTCINALVTAACNRVGTYLYLFPQTNQARRVIWRGMDAAGMRFLDHLPQELIARTNSVEMTIELVNGSLIILGGSSNYNAFMGMNPVGIVYSEFPLHTPLARQYLKPILVENGGWEILQGTPRGKNHAYEVYQLAMNDPTWFVRRLTIEDTHKLDGTRIITDDDIAQERRHGVPEELIRQEYYCDFSIGVQGAYYTKEIDTAERESRIKDFAINPSSPVYTSWDLGISDATSIWFFQQNGAYVDFIGYYENTGEGIEHYIDIIKNAPAKYGFRTYGSHFAPHDIANRSWLNPRSGLQIAAERGVRFERVEANNPEEGIQAVKNLFHKMRFHATNCAHGITCLREYRRKYDELNKVYNTKPLHDWTSNGADALRTMAMRWTALYSDPRKSGVRTYERVGFLADEPPIPQPVRVSGYGQPLAPLR